MQKIIHSIVLCVVVIVGPPGRFTVGASSAILTVSQLETNATEQPLGIDDRNPRFTWLLQSNQRGISQTAFRVIVASQRDLAHQGKGDVWDSKRVSSSDAFVVYSGPALKSRTRYYWSVRVWANGAIPARWSTPSWFETALLNTDEWRGQWIAGPQRSGPVSQAEGIDDDDLVRRAGEFCRPVSWLTSGFAAQRFKNDQGQCRELRPTPMLRKSFQLTKPVAKARVYSSGLAYNNLTINGKATSDSVLDPAFTNYSKTVLYTTHDVTASLRQGENVLAAELGSGQFDASARSWDWGWEKAEWRMTPALKLDLYITFTDGSEQLVSTDSSWRVSVAGPTRYDSYYLGETYDARREIAGWNRPGFNDGSWSVVRVVDGPTGILRAQTQEPIRIVNVVPPGTRSTPEPGIVVYDIGQNLTGWVEIKVNAPASTAVEIFYSEKLDKSGKATTAGNDLVFGQLQTDYYIVKGSGNELWTPRFSYKGFQYVQLSGPNGQPLPNNVSASVERVHQARTSLRGTSGFNTDSKIINRIHDNTAWAIQNNIHGIITDTPVYEKNGWTGDAQLTAGAASTLFDTERLYTKMFQDMVDAQTEQGEVSLLSPSNKNYGYAGKPFFKPTDCCGATPAWDAFWFIIPWESHRRYGDVAALEKTYPSMQKYLDNWIPQWTNRDGDSFSYTLTSGLGDWVAPQGVPTLNALVSTAYYAHLTEITANVARVLGKKQDAERYNDLFNRIRNDFNARFLSDKDIYREKDSDSFVQTAQILPLAFGLVPESKRSTIAARLADDIMKNRGGHAYVGVLGARYVLPVLSETGHHDVALTVATQTAEPSWGYWIDIAKFTALGESWPADTRSRNHHFFGSIVQWFYEDLAGIRPLEPGFKRIEFKPQIPHSALNRVSAYYESVRGRVVVNWRRTATGLQVDIGVPPNATGRVYLPVTNLKTVTEIGSGKVIAADKAPSVKFIGTEGDRAVYDIGSGLYQFRVASR